jgi:hypothetical protein
MLKNCQLQVYQTDTIVPVIKIKIGRLIKQKQLPLDDYQI